MKTSLLSFSASSRQRVLLAMIYLAIFGSQQLFGWPIVRIWGASPWGHSISADLNSVLRSADCLKGVPFEQFFSQGYGDCDYIYGNFLIFTLNGIGLTHESTAWMSWLFLILASLIFADLTFKYFQVVNHWGLRGVAFLALCSPPVALLLERANFDVLIFSMVYCAALLARKGRWPLSVALLCVAVLMKFYAIFAILMFLVTEFRRRTILGIAFLFSLVTLEIVGEFLTRKPPIPADVGGAFGSYAIGLWFNFSTDYLSIPLKIDNLTSWLVGCVALALGIVFLAFMAKKNPFFTQDFGLQSLKGHASQKIATSMGLVFFGCYLAGANFDYRLVFFIPFALFLIANSKDPKNQKLLAVLLLLATWLSYDSGVIGQVIGDGVMIVWAAIAFLSIYKTLLPGVQAFLGFAKSKN